MIIEFLRRIGNDVVLTEKQNNINHNLTVHEAKIAYQYDELSVLFDFRSH